MKYEQYTSLITELEEYAAKNPKGYEGLGEFGIHYFVILEKNFENLRPRLEQIDNAKIYQR